MLAEGEVQRSKEGVIHLMATRIVDRTAMLDGRVTARQCAPTLPMPTRSCIRRCRADTRRSIGHPRNVRILPKSRDFH